MNIVYRMKCSNRFALQQKEILEYALQNVTILYIEIKCNEKQPIYIRKVLQNKCTNILRKI